MIFGECNLSGADFVLDFIKCTFNFADVGQGSIAGIGLLFAGIFAIYGLAKQNVGHSRAWIAAFFVGTIASFIMATLNFVPDGVPFICIIMGALGLFFLEKSTGEQ